MPAPKEPPSSPAAPVAADKNAAADKAAKKPKDLKPRPKVLGPVPNLEEHVRPDWWRGIFNSLYLKTDADVVDDQNITKQEIDLFYGFLGLKPEDRVLDLCCGQGRHSLELSRRGIRTVDGLDRSHYLISRAKSIARREGLNVRFREGDARKLPYPVDTFDAVIIPGNSFGYFESLNDDLLVLKGVLRVLKPWARVLIDVTDGEYMRNNFQPRSWEWIDKSHFVCRERSLSADGQRLISREVITHVGKGVIADQFYAERLYTAESLGTLLKQAGFGDFTVHAEITPDSQRNQDLGMMQRRLIITAVARKEWSAARKKPKEAVRNVTVVMGDPSKPDKLKPDSVFDDDDFFTIDELKGALRELKGYDFQYLTAHDTMFADLTKAKGKTDFILNLCDEGFDNDPRKELHVPAVFQMLGIPFTGSGPQCLAYCYDKSLVRGIARELKIPVPEAFVIAPEDKAFDLPLVFPVIVKPNMGDSSFGITQRSVVNSLEELLNALTEIRDKLGYEKPILVEEFLPGKDLSVGIIGNPSTGFNVLPITEEDYSELPPDLPRICGYEAKWDPASPYSKIKSIPASLPEDIEKSLVQWCLTLFERLDCRDYARLDWRLDALGNPRLLEVNPNPGWCWDGHLNKMAGYAGITYSGMLEAILRAAEARIGVQTTGEDKSEQAAGNGSGNGAGTTSAASGAAAKTGAASTGE